MARRRPTSLPAALPLLAILGCSDGAASAREAPPATPPIAEPANVQPLVPQPTPRAGELRPRSGLVLARAATHPRIAVGASGAIVAWTRRDCAQSERASVLTWAALEGDPPALDASDRCEPASVSLVLAPREAAAVVCRAEGACEVRGLGDVSEVEAVARAPEPGEAPITVDDQRRMVRRYRAGVDVPIAGIGAPVTTMASTVGERGPLVLWVEQAPPAHRVRVAWLDMTWTELGAAADLDVGDAVVGDVAIDAREGHVAIALTQRDERGDWVVRVAELTPP